jgi:hypothetical protein
MDQVVADARTSLPFCYTGAKPLIGEAFGRIEECVLCEFEVYEIAFGRG